MLESRPTVHRASVGVPLIALAALLLFAVVAPGSSHAGKASGCAKGHTGKKKSACHKPSARPHYKVVRRKFQVAVPHTAAEQGVSEVVTVECPHGEHVLGGGVEIWEPFLSVTLSAPDEATTGWSGQIVNLSTTTDALAGMSVYAVCEIEAARKR
jgi:hypothetical protein